MSLYFDYLEDNDIKEINSNNESILKFKITKTTYFNCNKCIRISYQLLGEVTLTLILTVLLIWTSVAGSDIHIQPVEFLERDPALSAGLYDSTVSFLDLVLITLVGPPILLSMCEIVKNWKISFVNYRSRVAYLALAYIQCISLTGTITNIIKLVVRRPRPNFFMLCDYMHIRDNVTFYLENTVSGAFGNYSNCFAELSNKNEAALSFPSGHSSFSFCAMLFLALYLRNLMKLPAGQYFTVSSAIASSPLVLASWVAITRVRNRWHNYDDISVGAIIGILCAIATWYNYTLSDRNKPNNICKIINEDDPNINKSPNKLEVML